MQIWDILNIQTLTNMIYFIDNYQQKIKTLLTCLLLLPSILFCNYSYNPYVPVEIWNEVEPYFLPIEHPVKKKLDRIFQKKRVTLSEQTFVEAGFTITRLNRPINAVVTGHKDLKGYLVKVYLDTQPAIPDWQMWLRRIKGVEIIQECLDKHQFKDFVLPKKWIYPLPANPSPPINEAYNRKNFILVVEDMHILDNKKNAKAYKEMLTPNVLNDLYTILTECGLTDCIWIGNMPFTKKKKIAFIDTELFHNGVPEFEKLKIFFSEPMQDHLDALMREGKFLP